MDLEVVSDSLWYRQKTSVEFYLDSGSGHRCMKTWNRYYTVCQIMAAKWLEYYRPIVAIVVWCDSHSGNQSLLPAIKGHYSKVKSACECLSAMDGYGFTIMLKQ